MFSNETAGIGIPSSNDLNPTMIGSALSELYSVGMKILS